MTWLQILAQAGVIATFLVVGIAVAAYFSGKHVKAVVGKLGEMIDGIKALLAEMEKNAEQRHQEFREFMKQTEQRHQELIQQHRDIVELMKLQHQDIVELLKRGFGGSAGGATTT
jgi:F0F1-type ATP synthase membrane subunit b/b'